MKAQRLVARSAVLLLPLACMVLGYLLVWQRGFNYDDYVTHNWTVDVVTGQWHPVVFRLLGQRPLGLTVVVNLAGIQPRWEFAVRAFSALIIAVNALLLTWLVYRLTRLRLVAVMTGWLFLMPVYAFEAALFLIGVQYSLAFFFALLFLHACYLAMTKAGATLLWIGLAGLLYIAAALCIEQTVLVAGMVPLLALYLVGRGDAISSRSALKTSLGILLIPALAAALLLVRYQHGGIVAQRGGLISDPQALVDHIALFTTQLANLTVSPNDGQRVMVQAFTLGFTRLRMSVKAMAVFGSGFVFLVVGVLAWQGRKEGDERDTDGAVALAVGGLVWAIASWLLPGVLVKDQWLAPRLLYLPLAGACVFVAALLWLVAKRLKHPAGEKAALAVAGIILLVSTVCMVGFARTYQERWWLDQAQVAAVLKAVPSQYLPENGYIVPLQVSEAMPLVPERLGQRVAGVMEHSSAAAAALRQAYHRQDIDSVTSNRWIPMVFSADTISGTLTLTGSDGTATAPIETTVFLTYEEGVARAIESLTLVEADGSQQTIRFPIAEALRAARIPTQANVILPAQ